MAAFRARLAHVALRRVETARRTRRRAPAQRDASFHRFLLVAGPHSLLQTVGDLSLAVSVRRGEPSGPFGRDLGLETLTWIGRKATEDDAVPYIRDLQPQAAGFHKITGSWYGHGLAASEDLIQDHTEGVDIAGWRGGSAFEKLGRDVAASAGDFSNAQRVIRIVAATGRSR